MQSQFAQALSYLESHEFAAFVGVASDARTLSQAILSHASARLILEKCRSDKSLLSEVLVRVAALTNQSIDPRYESPWDTALTALLIISSAVDPHTGYAAASMASKAPGTWWTAKIANTVLTQSLARHTETQTVVAEAFESMMFELTNVVLRQSNTPDVSYKIYVGDLFSQQGSWTFATPEVRTKLRSSPSAFSEMVNADTDSVWMRAAELHRVKGRSRTSSESSEVTLS